MFNNFSLLPSEAYVTTVQDMTVSCRSLITCSPGMLLRHFLNDFEMVPVTPILLVSLLFLHSTRTLFLL